MDTCPVDLVVVSAPQEEEEEEGTDRLLATGKKCTCVDKGGDLIDESKLICSRGVKNEASAAAFD